MKQFQILTYSVTIRSIQQPMFPEQLPHPREHCKDKHSANACEGLNVITTN